MPKHIDKNLERK